MKKTPKNKGGAKVEYFFVLQQCAKFKMGTDGFVIVDPSDNIGKKVGGAEHSNLFQ